MILIPVTNVIESSFATVRHRTVRSKGCLSNNTARNTGQVLIGVQRRVQHPVVRWMAATLGGTVEATGAVFEAKFMLPWSFTEEAAAEKYTPQLQHNMWVTNAKLSVLSIITGGGKWVEISRSRRTRSTSISFFTAEKKFWRCVESGEPPCPLRR